MPVKSQKKTKKYWRAENRYSFLIDAILQHFGGEAPLRKLLVIKSKGKLIYKRQNIYNWRDRGIVPLEHCYKIADLLEISPYALNYEGVILSNGTARPDWPDVVRTCKFLRPSEVVRAIGYRDRK